MSTETVIWKKDFHVGLVVLLALFLTCCDKTGENPGREAGRISSETQFPKDHQLDRFLADGTDSLLKNRSLDRLLADGNNALQEGDLKEAEARFKEALQLLNYLPEAHLGMAKVFLRKGDNASAIQELNSANDLACPEHQVEVALCYEQSGDTNRALLILKNLVRSDPFRADAEHSLAAIYENIGRNTLAKLHYRKAVILAPKRYANDLQKSFEIHTKIPGDKLTDLSEYANWASIDRFLSNLSISNLVNHWCSSLDKETSVFTPDLDDRTRAAMYEGNPYNVETRFCIVEREHINFEHFLKHGSWNHADSELFGPKSYISFSMRAGHGLDETYRLVAKAEENIGRKAYLLRKSIKWGGEDRTTIDQLKELCPPAIPTAPISGGLGDGEAELEKFEMTTRPKLEQEGKDEEILDVFLDHIEQFPRSSNAYLEAAKLCYLDRKYFLAEHYARRAVEITLTKIGGYAILYLALERQGQKEDAEKVMRWVMDNFESPKYFIELIRRLE